jgi:hypothetical protein
MTSFPFTSNNQSEADENESIEAIIGDTLISIPFSDEKNNIERSFFDSGGLIQNPTNDFNTAASILINDISIFSKHKTIPSSGISAEEAQYLLSAAEAAVKSSRGEETDGDALSTLLMLSKPNGERPNPEIDHKRKVYLKKYEPFLES